MLSEKANGEWYLFMSPVGQAGLLDELELVQFSNGGILRPSPQLLKKISIISPQGKLP